MDTIIPIVSPFFDMAFLSLILIFVVWIILEKMDKE